MNYTLPLNALLTNRLIAAKEFDLAMKRCAETEARTTLALVEKLGQLSEAMQCFVAESDLINGLLSYGRTSQKISHEDNDFGFIGGSEKIMSEFLALQQAWDNTIHVSFSEQISRTEVTISVVFN